MTNLGANANYMECYVLYPLYLCQTSLPLVLSPIFCRLLVLSNV